MSATPAVASPSAASFAPPAIAYDLDDAALLGTVYGVTVAFRNPAVPFCYPAETMTGVVQDVKTSPRGCRQLLVKSERLSLAKWIDVNDCQFVWAMALEG